MRHLWSVICQFALEDKTTNNLSLIETVEGIRFQIPNDHETEFISIPLSSPIQFVSMWWRTNFEIGEQTMTRVLILAPNGKELGQMSILVNLTAHLRFRSRIQLNGLPFTVNGIYEFEVQYQENDEWIPVTRIPLEIIREEILESEHTSETSSD